MRFPPFNPSHQLYHSARAVIQGRDADLLRQPCRAAVIELERLLDRLEAPHAQRDEL